MAMRADIAAPQRARGRPKGTGIDDHDRMVRLQEMLAADRSLKPTTAIKQLGVTDPSVIRRLRDKLAELAAPLEPAASKPTTKALLKSAPIKTEPAKPIPAARDKIVREKKEPAKSLAALSPAALPSVAPAPVAPQSAPVPAAPPQPSAPAVNITEQKAREIALLAAYLQAMQQAQPTPNATVTAEARPELKAAPRAEPPKPEPPKTEAPKAQPPMFPFAHMMPPMPMGFPGMPQMGMPQMGMPNPMQAFSIPGMPSFLQPFQQKQPVPQPGTDQARQLEALKLAIEATTAIARFQLHLVENAAAYSPMAMMLQGQSFIGQMMIAGLTGQLGALHRQMTNPAVKK